MVATRRQAYQEPATDTAALEVGTTLRKKPVRRATAKKAESESKATAAARGSTTKIAIQEDTCDVERKPINPPGPSKPARRAAGHGQNAVRSEEQEDNKVISNAVKPTRATIAKAKSKGRREPVAEEALPGQTEAAKPTRRTRATTTRAQPLSPKKITQVSRAPSRSTRLVDTKTKFKAESIAPRARTRTRKRTVSDENADVPQFPVSDSAHDTEDEIAAHSATPAKRVSPAKHSPQKDKEAESEASMSSKETTPAASPAPSFDRMEDENEYKRPLDVDELDSEAGEDVDATNDGEESADELCGPKTPMKRASPGTEARYLASVQRATHHTIEPANLSSPVRVAIDCLSPVPKASEHHNAAFTDDCETATAMAMATGRIQQDRMQAGTCISDNIEEVRNDGDISHVPEVACHEETKEPNNEAIDFDPEATIVVDAACADDIESDDEVDASFQTEEAVLITRAISLEHTAFLTGENVNIAETAEPETIVWENIRQDITIPVNFDAHLAASLQAADTESIPGLEFDNELNMPDLDHSVSLSQESCEAALITSASTTSESMDHGLLSAPDATVNLSDFIDLAAISEPTQNLYSPDVGPGDRVEQHESTNEMSTLDEASVNIDPTASEHQAVTADTGIVPHYALSTIAFDVRRKSLPIFGYRTPVKDRSRPNTSDGTGAPQSAYATARLRWILDTTSPALTLQRPRAGTATLTTFAGRPATSKEETPKRLVECPQTSARPTAERYPNLPSHNSYNIQPKTAMPATRFQTPAHRQPKRPATAVKPSATAEVPRQKPLHSRPKSIAAGKTPPLLKLDTPVREGDMEANPDTEAIRTPCERFPRLPPQPDYLKHANTAVAARFQTPNHSSPRRPATVHKEGAVSKITLEPSTPTGVAHRSIKTPLKPPAETPARMPMTPHPAAPLRAVVALVEVYTLEGANATSAFVALLHRLGAKTTKTWNDRITHVVFKDGSPKTLQRVRMHNQSVEESGVGTHIFCVNSRWVADCDTEGQRMDESDEAYAVDPTEVPRGGRRRRKSMEPVRLVHVDGNIVRARQSSVSRSSLGRSPLKTDVTPMSKKLCETAAAPRADTEKENSEDDDLASPATPAYLAAPDKLIQQTAPINRMRKLGSKTKDAAKMRRLTFFDGTV